MLEQFLNSHHLQLQAMVYYLNIENLTVLMIKYFNPIKKRYKKLDSYY